MPRKQSFMDWLREELRKIPESEIVAPDEELEDDDKVIGVLEDVEARKIYELGARNFDEMKRLQKELQDKVAESSDSMDPIENDHSIAHDPATCEGCTFVRQIGALKDRNDTLKKFFYACVHHELSDADRVEIYNRRNDVGIRKGWQIVLVADKSPLEELGELMGFSPT